MKRSALHLALSAIGCVLFLAAQSKADIIGCTSLDFDDGTGIIYGSAWIESDTGSSWDYDLDVNGYLSSDDGADYAAGGAQNFESLTAEVDLQVPARADMGYEIDGAYSVHVNYFEENERGGAEYIDEENYSYYLTQYVFNPNAYYFYGPGPSIVVSNRHIDLGETYSQKKVGAPHHIEVVSDVTASDCDAPKRRFTFRVVDINGHATGITPIRELFPEAIVNSCDGNYITPTGCGGYQTSMIGVATDTIYVGCLGDLHAPCGFGIHPNRYQWCNPRGSGPITIAGIDVEASDTSVTINGMASIPADTRIFAR